jgi:CRP-like cAMP-binding protein
MMGIKEKHRIRMRNRAKMILQMQDNELEDYKKGDFLYREGEIGDKLWLVDRGLVKVTIRGDHVFTAGKGNFTGEQAVIQGLKRNASAECVSDRCTVQRMAASEFQKLMDLYPDVMAAVREISQRRDLKKAVVLRLRDEFPYSNPIEAFCALGAKDEDDVVTMESLTQIMRDMDPDYSKEEIRELFNIMDLTNSGTISFDEFKKVFIADVKTSASI